MPTPRSERLEKIAHALRPPVGLRKVAGDLVEKHRLKELRAEDMGDAAKKAAYLKAKRAYVRELRGEVRSEIRKAHERLAAKNGGS